MRSKYEIIFKDKHGNYHVCETVPIRNKKHAIKILKQRRSVKNEIPTTYELVEYQANIINI